MTTLRITIEGAADLQTASRIVRALEKLLPDIERHITGERAEIKWEIVELGEGKEEE